MNKIEEALQDIKDGKIVIVVDDEDRENEGDFIIAAEKVTPEKVNFMMRYGRGVLCTPITEERCSELNLEMQSANNTSLHETPFTVTVDLLEHGCSTGVSAFDRASTINALANPKMQAKDFGRPGHINPLRARKGGVLVRAGHTEAAVDLARLAGLYPAGALIEILNDDGTMARLPELKELAKKYDMKIISVKDLIAYRIAKETLVKCVAKANLPTKFGTFKLLGFKNLLDNLEHVALVKGEITPDKPTLVRVHSECLTGDVFGSLRCDCSSQLHKSMEMIEENGSGVVLYMRQEGRGIGLLNKVRAYQLQDEEGFDTVDANLELGFPADPRDYGIGAQILRALGVREMKLMTNNPKKRVGLESYGLKVVEQIPIELPTNKYNCFYMQTKKEKMGHILKNI
ncbi:MAG: bifunctional 3,4-dihydroxy-2-butanone-4-phosphate synthase/GTP cyclohydrolase II [Ignavibacteria bacterium]|jgi:3,4-dihydroxy 2-butanone 4-phosphate synthase/GTP cyclohydrolase II|nr:bifunctional 3,4-dihydroxy-2-butanone-4-phosphate synthase/GTP cyclohydrolase II [Ignavibacteria bacterium]